MRCSAFAALFISFAAVPASSQSCLGHSSFGRGHARIAGRYVDQPGADLFGVSGAYGRIAGAFGAAEYVHVSPRNVADGASGGSDGMTGSLGAQYAPASLGGLQICPLATLGVVRSSSSGQVINSTGQNTGTFDVDSHSYTWGIGAAAGFVTDISPAVTMTPSLELDYRSASTSGTTRVNGVPRDFSAPGRAYGYWVASIGFGYRTWTLAPTLERAFALAHQNTLWGVRMAYNFNLPR